MTHRTHASRPPTDRLASALDHARHGRPLEALYRLEELVREYPGDLDTRLHLGAIALEVGQPDTALPHLAAVAQARPSDPQLIRLYGSALQQAGRYRDAANVWNAYAERRPEDGAARLHAAQALLADEDIAGAEAVLAPIMPAIQRDPAALGMVGDLYHAGGLKDRALEHYRAAIALDPQARDTRLNLAVTLLELGQAEAAEREYRSLIDADPGDALALQSLGTLYKEQDRLEEAMALYQQARAITGHRLTAGEVTAAEAADRVTSVHNLRLEMEQLEHLARERIQVEGSEALIAGYRKTLAEVDADGIEGHRRRLTPAQFERIGSVMHRVVHVEPLPRLEGGALNPTLDGAALEAAFHESGHGLVVIDDFLTDEAVTALRRYLQRSSIWPSYARAGGYSGAYLQDGFGGPLLLQLSEELRAALPEVVGPHVLNQMWAYIYDQRLSGITAHADPAAVNLNFWVTRDEANLDPDSGGLVVYTREAPAEWDFEEYNNRPDDIEAFAASSEKVVVPYRCNRAVMFNSNLVHKTDDFSFRPGFENRRVNVTMLFGKRQGS